MARALVWKLLIVFCGLFIAETLASRHRRHHRSPSKTPVKIYGHVHMPKTAGANLNAVIAARFERVCGHKGYSFDAHQANMRYAETARAYNSSSGDNKAGKQELDTGPLVVDSYTALYRLHNRHRVPRTIMDEIGYENCDWISHEAEADVWSRFQKWGPYRWSCMYPAGIQSTICCRSATTFSMYLIAMATWRQKLKNASWGWTDFRRLWARTAISI